MAALDFFLELEPVDAPGVSPAAAQPACGSPSAASADTAVAAWAFKAPPHAAKPQLPQKRQRQLDAYSTDEEEEGGAGQAGPELSASPGCSYSAPAGLAAGLLDLEDDACSAPAQQQQAAQQQQRRQLGRGRGRGAAATLVLPDGVPLVAATFFDDLAAGGSVWRYCTQRQ